MHSRVTCQIHGFNYDMFEQIRNYNGESEQETEQNIKKAIEDWKNTQELEYAISYMNQKQNTNHSIDCVTDVTITDLAAFFELLRKKTKSVVFGVVYGITPIGLADQIESTKEEAQQLIDGFKSSLPKYLLWEASVHRQIMERGYIETALGRKRRFAETIHEAMQDELYKRTGFHWKIEKCKRQGGNAIIQGLVN